MRWEEVMRGYEVRTVETRREESWRKHRRGEEMTGDWKDIVVKEGSKRIEEERNKIETIISRVGV